ncbi:MAG: 2TM domain-containing protein [Burkholderiaceae bacterium]
MEQPSTPEIDLAQREAQIRERVRRRADFYRSLLVYCIAVPIMLLVNFLLVPQSGYWSLMVMGIWGLVLGVQAVQTFMLRGWLSQDWEARKIEEVMRRQQEQHKP